MGVLGLWQLLQATGQPVNLESLTGKTLAVDVSMWMHQLSKGMRDRHGNPVPNAHLVGLFRRICKLLFYHVKPIVVFDGGAPILKRQTLANRRQHREEAVNNSNRNNKKLISKLLKYHAIGNAVAPSTSGQSKPVLGNAVPKQDDQDLFRLPPIPTVQPDVNSQSGDEDKQDVGEPACEDVVEKRSRYYEQMKELHKHNIDSESFEALPLDVKHEILSDLKDSNKRTDWATISSIPKDSGDFSSFQLNRLIKQNKLSQLLENVRQEMNYSAGGLDSIVEVAEGATVETNRVMSDDTAQYVLIKGGTSHEPLTTLNETTDANHIENDEDSQEMPSSSQKIFRMNDSFAIRKIAKDRNAGRKFAAPVSEIKLSSSSSDEEEVIIRPKVKPKAVVSPPSSLVTSSSLAVNTTTTAQQVATPSVKPVIPLASLPSVQPAMPSASLPSVQLSVPTAAGPIKKLSNSLDANEDLAEEKKQTDLQTDVEVAVTRSSEIKVIETTSSQNLSVFSKPTARGPVKGCHQIEADFTELVKKPQLTAISVHLDPTKIPSDDLFDDLFPASVFASKSPGQDSSAVSPERNLAADLNEIDIVPDLNIDETEDAARNQENPFIGLSEEGLVDMQHDLAAEAKELQSERGKQERLASGITNQMHVDAQELLQLFGVPFLVSPMEAEAQCAYLDYTNQTHGTITDDSDVWLFGGRRVYKNLFNQGRDVELYTIETIENDMALDRDLLINIALLCGSDYTEGIPGVGPVTALDLLAEFPGVGLEKLLNFAKWWRDNKDSAVKQTRLRSRLLQLQVRDGFPSRTVVEAYLRPTVDESNEAFTWGDPNIDGLREFARSKLSWGRGQADELLLPMLKNRSKATQVQTKLTSYFGSEQRTTLSKRLQLVVKRLRSGVCGSVLSSKTRCKQNKRRRTQRRKADSSSSSGASSNGASADDDDDDAGGFIRKRPTGRRIITSDDEGENDEISDSEMAMIDIDNMTGDVDQLGTATDDCLELSSETEACR